MEKFEQNLHSEDMQKDTPVFNTGIITASEHLEEVLEHEDAYKPSEILKGYDDTVADLQKDIQKLESYISAKNSIEVLRYDLDQRTLGSRSIYEIDIAERMKDIEHFSLIIKTFEESGAPEKDITAAKEKVVALQKKLETISDIQRVAKNTPDYN